MITFFIALATGILYAQWIGKRTVDYPEWFYVFLGLVWAWIVVFSVMY